MAKKKKRIFRERFFWRIILGTAFCFTVFYFFLFSPVFQIKEIRLTGESEVAKENIVSNIEENLNSTFLVFKTKSIFLADAGQIRESLLRSFPKIEGVVFKRELPAVLDVKVTEREGRALWCQTNEKCFLVDKEGVIFKIAEDAGRLMQIQIEGAEPQAELGKSVISRDVLFSVLEVKPLLEKNANLKIEKAQVVSQSRVNFKTSEGWEIFFNLKEDFEWQAAKLALVLEKGIPPEKRGSLEYVDLRFTRVYYK